MNTENNEKSDEISVCIEYDNIEGNLECAQNTDLKSEMKKRKRN